MIQPKKILVAGYFGFKNTGDEAILQSTLEGLRKQKPDLEFSVVSGDPKGTSKMYGVQSVQWQDMDAIINAAKECDMVLLGGGGLFQDYWDVKPESLLTRKPVGITYYAGFPFLAHLLHKPSLIYSVGIGPLQTAESREITRLGLQAADLVSVRDGESERIALELGLPAEKIQLTADPAFNLEKDQTGADAVIQKLKLDPEKPVVGVCIRNWNFRVEQENWQAAVADALDRFEEETSCELVFVPFHTLADIPLTDDVGAAKSIVKRMTHKKSAHILKAGFSAGVVTGILASCDMVICARLHSIILAAKEGVPVVGLIYDPKVRQVMVQLSMDEYALDLKDLTSEDLFARMQKVWSGKQRIRETLLARALSLRKTVIKTQKDALHLMEKWHPSTEKPQDGDLRNFALKQTLLLSQREETLSSLNTKLEQSQNLIQQLSAQVNDKETLLHILSRQSAETRQKLQTQIQTLNVNLEKQISHNKILTTDLENQIRHSEILNTNLENQYKNNQSLNEQLNSIFRSKAWGLIRSYYKVRQKLSFQKCESITALPKEFSVISTESQGKDQTPLNIVSPIIEKLNARKLKGVFIVTSAFVFDEFYNQRVINLSKFLGKNGWGVVFVAWRWSIQENIPNVGKEVFSNIYQIPVDIFLENLDSFSQLNTSHKYFMVEFPHPEFLPAALKLRNHEFKIVYEIIDEWEAFHKAAQAVWYDRAVEEAFVINANALTAVSQPLVNKFSFLRKDILLVPNGFDPGLLGRKHVNIACHKKECDEIHIGYFGHLTDSWFDWDFLIAVLRLADKRNVKIKFHLIGYGGPDLSERVEEFLDKIILHGRVNPSRLHDFVKDWDAAMIPFKDGSLAEAVDPIKLYEYLFFGLPVIVKGIDHLKICPNVEIVNDVEHFLKSANQVKNKPLRSKNEILNRFLKESTWDQRFEKLQHLVEKEPWKF